MDIERCIAIKRDAYQCTRNAVVLYGDMCTQHGKQRYAAHVIHVGPSICAADVPVGATDAPVVHRSNSTEHIPKAEKIIPSETEEIKEKITKMGINCPVCMELVEDDDDCGLICGHDLHIICSKGLVDNKCPVCRTKINSSSNLSDDQLRRIKKNKANYREEMDNEEDDVSMGFIRDQFGVGLVQGQYQNNEMVEIMVPQNIIVDAVQGYLNRQRHAVPDPLLLSPEYNDMIAQICDIYISNPDFQADPASLHKHLHTLYPYSCEFLDGMIDKAIDIMS